MDFFKKDLFYYLYISDKHQKPLLSDRSVDDLVRLANHQLIRAKWVIKDGKGEVIKTYQDPPCTR